MLLRGSSTYANSNKSLIMYDINAHFFTSYIKLRWILSVNTEWTRGLIGLELAGSRLGTRNVKSYLIILRHITMTIVILV